MKKGMKKGLAEGMAQGMAEGMAEGKAEIARNMKKEGFDIAMIAKITGLPLEKIGRLE